MNKTREEILRKYNCQFHQSQFLGKAGAIPLGPEEITGTVENIFAAMEEFASQQKGCRWVKIKSEKDLPKKDGRYFCNIDIPGNNLELKKDIVIFINGEFPKWHYEYFNHPEGSFVWEWLDESSPCACEEVERLKEEVERLRKQLSEALNKYK